MSYFSHSCAISGESISISSSGTSPQAVVFYPDGTKDRGTIDGLCNIGGVNYLGKIISMLGGIKPENVHFDLSKMKINVFLGQPTPGSTIQRIDKYDTVQEFVHAMKTLSEDIFGYRAFNVECPTYLRNDEGQEKKIDFETYLVTNDRGVMVDPFDLPPAFQVMTNESLMEGFKGKVIMENTTLELFNKALGSLRIAKADLVTDTTTYESLARSPTPRKTGTSMGM